MNDIVSPATLGRPASLPPEAVYGNGLTALSGDQLKLYRKLEDLYLSWAAECNAVEYQFPVMIPARELNKIGYFKSFPHHLTFPVSLDSEHKNLADFVARDVIGAEGEVSLAGCQCAPVYDVLTPAACYHFYANFQGSELDKPLYLTTRATCFRKEVKYTPLRRQWSFSMRELVCIGTAAEVGAFLDERRARVEQLFQKIGLPISWDGATDPFFNPSSNPKYLAQKLDPVKTEMVFGGDLAIGSVNFHRNYFGEAFKISRNGEDAYSGCVAFGVERWIAALTTHFGADPAAWPNLDIRS